MSELLERRSTPVACSAHALRPLERTGRWTRDPLRQLGGTQVERDYGARPPLPRPERRPLPVVFGGALGRPRGTTPQVHAATVA